MKFYGEGNESFANNQRRRGFFNYPEKYLFYCWLILISTSVYSKIGAGKGRTDRVTLSLFEKVKSEKSGSQFHQHFRRAFIADILAPKITKLKQELWKHFCTKNALVKCWWNRPRVGRDWGLVFNPPSNGANERSEICEVSRGGNFFN